MINMKIQDIMPIQEWAVENEPSKDMLWYKGYWDQICFIRDQIGNILFSGDWKKAKNEITIVNTHVSKSIKLPVYHINLENKYGIELIMRYNFYDWKVSVKSLKAISTNFMNLFDEGGKVSYLYCEGFQTENVYDSYKNNKNKFTVELYDNYQLYTFIWILKNYLETN